MKAATFGHVLLTPLWLTLAIHSKDKDGVIPMASRKSKKESEVRAVFSAFCSAQWCLENKMAVIHFNYVMCTMFLTLIVLPSSRSGASDNLAQDPP